MSQSANIKTACGTVNRAKLEELQASFDTMRLLEAIDLVDNIRRRFCDPQAIRSEVLALHPMAHALINDAPLVVLGGDNRVASIWERATDLELELSDYAEQLGALADLLEELSALAPDDEWEQDPASAELPNSLGEDDG